MAKILAETPIEKRSVFFDEYLSTRSRLRKRTKSVLWMAIVEVTPQFEIVRSTGLHKQSVNRTLKEFSVFAYLNRLE